MVYQGHAGRPKTRIDVLVPRTISLLVTSMLIKLKLVLSCLRAFWFALSAVANTSKQCIPHTSLTLLVSWPSPLTWIWSSWISPSPFAARADALITICEMVHMEISTQHSSVRVHKQSASHSAPCLSHSLTLSLTFPVMYHSAERLSLSQSIYNTLSSWFRWKEVKSGEIHKMRVILRACYASCSVSLTSEIRSDDSLVIVTIIRSSLRNSSVWLI